MKQGDALSLPKGWEVKHFQDVCELIGGSQPSKDEFIFEPKEGYIRLIQVRDYRTDKFITYIPKDKARRFCNKEDIMIGRYGPPIFGIFKGLEGAYNVALMKAVVNEKICSKDYFYWFLRTDDLRQFVEHSSKRAAGQDGVRKELLDKYPVLLPPLPEQQRIVAILDEAFAAIDKAKAKAERNLKNVRELFESYLQGVFENPKVNWEVCNLETYIKLIDYRGRTPVKTESGVRLVTAKNVKLGHLQLEPQEFIAESNYENWMSRGIPNFGDVIFTTEAPLANVAQIDTFEKLAFAQRIIVMQPKPSKLKQSFLKYMLLSNPIRNRILEKGTGATVLGIKSSLLKRIEIYFPKSIEVQEGIVEKLDALSIESKKLETLYQQKISDLEELRKSVLQKAFAGKLAVPAKVTKVISMPVKVVGITATDLQAGIVALAIQRHQEMNSSNTLHHVKVEKIVHLAEYILEMDLERNPFKDAAGPNDFPHSKKVESRAAKAGFYTVKKVDGVYTYTAGSQLNKHIAKVKSVLKEREQPLIQLVDLMVPMKTQQAEIFATVYAAWNNLLIDNLATTDEAIVYEARENWHIDKLKIPRGKFFAAIDWMKKKNIIPKGIGKKVLSKNKK